MKAIEIFRRDLLLRRGVAAWKKFSYRMRVHYYLSGKQRLRYGAKFLANLRERFFEARTEKMKYLKAESQHEQTLLVKSLVSLRLRAQYR